MQYFLEKPVNQRQGLQGIVKDLLIKDSLTLKEHQQKYIRIQLWTIKDVSGIKD